MKTTLQLFIFSLILLNISCQSQKQDKPSPFAGKAQSAEVVSVENSLLQNTRQITFVGSKAGEGYFSADGQRMIFQSERHPGNPFYQMYILDFKTGQTRLVSPGIGKTTCGWIHPTEDRILFSSTHHDPQVPQKTKAEFEQRKNPVKGRYSWSFDEFYDIYTSSSSGKNLKNITKTIGYDAEASYSPDGKLIAFASNRKGYTDKLSDEDMKFFKQDPSYMMDIYVMNSDGSNIRQLTTSKGYDGGPFLSADGKKITWRRFNAQGSSAEIYTMNVDGSEQKQVTHLKSMSWAPYFHPSGDYLIFGSSVFGYSNFELFIVDSAGKNKPVRVTFNEGFDGLPVFTPDGLKLSWTLRNEKGDSQIMMADWDDLQARKLLGLPPAKPQIKKFNPEIRDLEIRSLVQFLSSEEMGGRKTGSPQEKYLNEFYAEAFKSWGLVGAGPNGSFFHSFEYTSGVELAGENTFEVVGANERKFTPGKDYTPLSFTQTGQFNQAAPIVFAGYGLKVAATEKFPAYDSYKDLDVSGKWVVVLEDIPEDVSSELRAHYNTYSRAQHKATVAKNLGALGLILIQNPLLKNKDLGPVKFEGTLSNSSIPVLRLSFAAGSELFKGQQKDLASLKKELDSVWVSGFAFQSVYAKAKINLEFKKSQGTNVLARLKVSGSKDKSVLIGAHGDHLGSGEFGSSLARGTEKGRIHPGADDNASGVAGILELAHYFSDLQKKNQNSLKQDLVFAIWSGEEIGILGSTALVQDWKKINQKELSEQVTAYLNMDMIGRLRDRLYVQGLGSGDYWSQLVEETGVRTALSLGVSEDPYLPTDSMALYMGGIPTLNLFTGAHSEYHTPRDTWDTLNYIGVQKVLQFAKTMTGTLADSTQSLVKYVKVSSAEKQMQGRSFRIFLGTIPDYSQEGVKGVRISGAAKESPADKAGLQPQDIIVEFDGIKIENLYDYVYTLQSVKADKETSIKVRRKGELQTLKITPKLKE